MFAFLVVMSALALADLVMVAVVLSGAGDGAIS